jgi:hypothetical protein
MGAATYCDTLHRQVIIAPFKSLINVQPLMYYTLQLSSLKYCIQLQRPLELLQRLQQLRLWVVLK